MYVSKNSIHFTQGTGKTSPAALLASGRVNMALVLSDVSKVYWSRSSKKPIPRPKMGLNVQEFYERKCRFDLGANVIPVQEKERKGWVEVSHTIMQSTCDSTKPKP